MLKKLHKDVRHSLVKIVTNFERLDSGLQMYDSIVKISMMKFTPEDLF
jgi:hypothetical protein